MKKSFGTGSPWEDTLGYTRAVRIDNIIEVAGTTASQNGEVQCIGDPYGQTQLILTIIKESIEQLGGSIEDVIRTRIYCTNISQWQEIGKAHGEVFSSIKPAMAMVEVAKLINPDMLVEIEATAIITK